MCKKQINRIRIKDNRWRLIVCFWDTPCVLFVRNKSDINSATPKRDEDPKQPPYLGVHYSWHLLQLCYPTSQKKNFFRNNSCYLAGRVQLRFFHLYQITDFRGIEDMVGISRNRTKNAASKCRRQSDCATPRSWPNNEKLNS